MIGMTQNQINVETRTSTCRWFDNCPDTSFIEYFKFHNASNLNAVRLMGGGTGICFIPDSRRKDREVMI